jgi:hypothetical protein
VPGLVARSPDDIQQIGLIAIRSDALALSGEAEPNWASSILTLDGSEDSCGFTRSALSTGRSRRFLRP